MGRLQDQSTSNPTSIAQKAAVAALNGPNDTSRRCEGLSRSGATPSSRCSTRFPASPAGCLEGAFYAFPNISALIGKRAGDKAIGGSDDLAAFLLEEAEVAVVPGSGFGADHYIRLSYATSTENIVNGVGRMGAAIRKLE